MRGEAGVVEREPALVDDEQRRPAVEPGLDAMEQIGEHGGRGAGADQPFGLEGLNVGLAETLGLGVEQPAVGPAEAIGLQAPASARWTAAAPTRPVSVRSPTGALASEVSADQRCSLTSGVTVDSFAGENRRDPFRRPARSAGVRSIAASGCKRDRLDRVIRERAAEIVPVAAHGERRRADRAAEVEGEDLGTPDSAGTAAPSAPAARDLPAPVGPTTSVWPTSPTWSEKPERRRAFGLARRAAAAPPRCSSRSGPAHTAESGIMWARLRVETGGWRTLA